MTSYVSESKISERLFKLEDILSFDSEAGKKTTFYETALMAGAVWCLEPGQQGSVTTLILHQMIFGFVCKGQAPSIQVMMKRWKLRREILFFLKKDNSTVW